MEKLFKKYKMTESYTDKQPRNIAGARNSKKKGYFNLNYVSKSIIILFWREHAASLCVRFYYSISKINSNVCIHSYRYKRMS